MKKQRSRTGWGALGAEQGRNTRRKKATNKGRDIGGLGPDGKGHEKGKRIGKRGREGN